MEDVEDSMSVFFEDAYHHHQQQQQQHCNDSGGDHVGALYSRAH
jgi:hypothetical protein